MSLSSDVHTLVGAYLLDAVGPAEIAAVDTHLDACEACANEVAELQVVTGILAADAAVRPPASLRAAVLAKVSQTRQLPPPLTDTREPFDPSVLHLSGLVDLSGPPAASERGPARTAADRRWHQGRRPLVAVAAALAAVCLGLGFVVTDQRAELDTGQGRVETLSALAGAAVDSPTATPVAGGGRIALVRSGDEALLVTRDLPELPPDRTYQLWLEDSGSLVRSAGTFTEVGNQGDNRVINLKGLKSDDKNFCITVEPAGGSMQPTTPILAAVSLNAAQRS